MLLDTPRSDEIRNLAKVRIILSQNFTAVRGIKLRRTGGTRAGDHGPHRARQSGQARLSRPAADTDGRPLMLHVHFAPVQWPDGAVPLLTACRRSFLFANRVFTDSVYAAGRVADAAGIGIEIVQKPAGQIGSAVHPRRWAIERCLSRLNASGA